MIDIVFVNWNAGSLLRDAVVSIIKYHSDLVATVAVVDNHSSDNSIQLVEELGNDFPFELKIIKNTTNNGFGAACNQGASVCSSKYILFLNPDAQLFENSLRVPYEYMENPEHKDVGICGIQLLEEDNHVARSCTRFPSFTTFTVNALGLNKLPFKSFKSMHMHMGEWDHLSTREVDQVIGAFFFMRRAIFDQLKGFDERFFVYFEDLDLAYRTKQAGYKSMYLADAQAFHAGGGTSNQVKATRLFYSLRSRLIYSFTHMSFLKAAGITFVTLFLEPFSRSALGLLKGSTADVKNTWIGYGMLWKALPAVLRGRTR
ncbi:MAG: glycosyltransferase family 2 protein [Neisseria sp.]|uniref:glycosyltransferase family 2 protein n=1 Tax=Neisseria sp. TaxID=192066 RepID=UPI0026DBA06E|nr:glycosyltransferase family 2 protein [Neisseria sp.]MDO4641788.1 glycosyltransferase family 2 protein [Neisseria sp.]